MIRCLRCTVSVNAFGRSRLALMSAYCQPCFDELVRSASARENLKQGRPEERNRERERERSRYRWRTNAAYRERSRVRNRAWFRKQAYFQREIYATLEGAYPAEAGLDGATPWTEADLLQAQRFMAIRNPRLLRLLHALGGTA